MFKNQKNNEIEQEILKSSYEKVEEKKNIFERFAPMVPDWIERGKEYIYPQRMPEWVGLVIDSLNTSAPILIEYALVVMEAINSGVSYQEAYKSMRETIDPDYTYDVTMMVANYSKKGIEFLKAIDPAHYEHHKKHFDKVEAENTTYQAVLGE